MGTVANWGPHSLKGATATHRQQVAAMQKCSINIFCFKKTPRNQSIYMKYCNLKILVTNATTTKRPNWGDRVNRPCSDLTRTSHFTDGETEAQRGLLKIAQGQVGSFSLETEASGASSPSHTPCPGIPGPGDFHGVGWG